MKRVLTAFIAMIALLCTSGAMAGNVKMSPIGEMNGQKAYLCDETLVAYRENGTTYAQMWVFQHNPEADLQKGEATEQWYLYEIIPNMRRMHQVEIIFRYSDGRVWQNNYAHTMATHPPDSHEYKFAELMSGWPTLMPGSMAEAIYNAINKAYNKR